MSGRGRTSHGRADGNQPSIVRGLRQLGCRVEVLSRVGHGCPDLLVGTPRRLIVLLEVKSSPRAKLTPDQTLWHREWQGWPVYVVCSLAEAVAAIDHDCRVFDIDGMGRAVCAACLRELAR